MVKVIQKPLSWSECDLKLCKRTHRREVSFIPAHCHCKLHDASAHVWYHVTMLMEIVNQWGLPSSIRSHLDVQLDNLWLLPLVSLCVSWKAASLSLYSYVYKQAQMDPTDFTLHFQHGFVKKINSAILSMTKYINLLMLLIIQPWRKIRDLSKCSIIQHF